MKKLYLLLFFSNFIYSNNIKVNDSVKVENITIFNSIYKDFTTVKKLVYAITKGDSLISIDLKKRTANFLFSNIKTIAKTSKNEIIGINTNCEIFKLKNKKIKIIDSVKGDFQKIYLDKNDNPLIISSIGIYYLKEYHIPKNKLNVWPTIHNKNGPISIADYAYIDKKNRLWLTYDRGEFGDDTVIFNLITKEFQSCDNLYIENTYYIEKDELIHNKNMLKTFPDKLKIVNDSIIFKFPYNLPINDPIKGIAENNNGEILISQSLMHFGFSGKINLIFEEEPYFGYYDLDNIIEKVKLNSSPEIDYIINEYIGTCTFNKFNNHFYYYSDKGFYKIIDENKVFSKEFIFKPWITWNSGLALALGYEMNVNKFEFLSKKEIVFLTANNGVGYFNGTDVIYYK